MATAGGANDGEGDITFFCWMVCANNSINKFY